MPLATEVLLKIKEEILNDPENLGYAGKTAWDQAALLNQPRSLIPKQYEDCPTEISSLFEVLLMLDLYAPLYKAAQDPQNPAYLDAFRVVQFIGTGRPVIHLFHPAVKKTIDNLVQLGLLTDQNRDVINSFGKREVLKARVDTLQIPSPSEDDVKEALALN